MSSYPKHLLAASLVLSPAIATADYTTVAPIRPLTMSDPSGLTVVGLDVQFTRWTVPPLPPIQEINFTSLTFDLVADIKLAPHWMLVARIPLSYASVDGDPANADCCGLAPGNVTLGGRGLWSSVFESGTRAVAGGELTLSLPTASDNGDGAVSASSAALAHLPRDPGRYAPNTTTIRFTTLAQIYNRWLLAQAEAGLQLYLYDDDVPGGDSTDLGVRLATGVGVRATYQVAIIAELSALLLDSNQFAGNSTITSIDLGVRYAARRGVFGFRVYLPIDAELRDLDMLGFGFDAGVRF